MSGDDDDDNDDDDEEDEVSVESTNVDETSVLLDALSESNELQGKEKILFLVDSSSVRY